MHELQYFIEELSLERMLTISAAVLMFLVLAISVLGWLGLKSGSRFRFLATAVPVCAAVGFMTWGHFDWTLSGRDPVQFLFLLVTVQCVGGITLLRMFRWEKDKLERSSFGRT